VPEKYSSAVKPGTKVKFTVQGDEAPHDATVMATEEGIDVNDTATQARAVVKNKDAALKPGAFANVELELGHNTSALSVFHAGRYSPGAEQTIDNCEERQSEIRSPSQRACARRPRLKCSTASLRRYDRHNRPALSETGYGPEILKGRFSSTL